MAIDASADRILVKALMSAPAMNVRPAPDQHDGDDGRVGVGGGGRGDDRLEDAGPERVDGRIVHRQHGDTPDEFNADDISHPANISQACGVIAYRDGPASAVWLQASGSLRVQSGASVTRCVTLGTRVAL